MLHNEWKLGHELTILSVSVDMKFVISPTVNLLLSLVDDTDNVLRKTVDKIAALNFKLTIAIYILK